MRVTFYALASQRVKKSLAAALIMTMCAGLLAACDDAVLDGDGSPTIISGSPTVEGSPFATSTVELGTSTAISGSPTADLTGTPSLTSTAVLGYPTALATTTAITESPQR